MFPLLLYLKMDSARFPWHTGPCGWNKVTYDFATQMVFLNILYCTVVIVMCKILESPLSTEIGKEAQISGSHKVLRDAPSVLESPNHDLIHPDLSRTKYNNGCPTNTNSQENPVDSRKGKGGLIRLFAANCLSYSRAGQLQKSAEQF